MGLRRRGRPLLRETRCVGCSARTPPSLSGVTLHDSARVDAVLDFYTSGHAAEAVLLGMDGQVLPGWAREFGDVFPTNSIQVLRGAPAKDNDAFAAGNILLSSRNLDDGRLILFDNGSARRGSAVQIFDKTNKQLASEYRGTDVHPFYSRTCRVWGHSPPF